MAANNHDYSQKLEGAKLYARSHEAIRCGGGGAAAEQGLTPNALKQFTAFVVHSGRFLEAGSHVARAIEI